MKIEKFDGDMFWNDDDTENAIYDPDDELDNINVIGTIVEFQQAKRLTNFFGVDCGEDSESNPLYEYFTTLEEAEIRSDAILKPTAPEGKEV